MPEFVIDACSFKLFYDELIDGTNGSARQAIDRLIESQIVILDTSGHIRHEWQVTCSSSNVPRLIPALFPLPLPLGEVRDDKRD